MLASFTSCGSALCIGVNFFNENLQTSDNPDLGSDEKLLWGHLQQCLSIDILLAEIKRNVRHVVSNEPLLDVVGAPLAEIARIRGRYNRDGWIDR